MPFTPSHAAAALLFRRTPLVVSAVVIGSVAPDLPYFLPVSTGRSFTHTPLGLVSIDLGIGLVTFLAWVLVLRVPLLDLGPRWLADRMPRSWLSGSWLARRPRRTAAGPARWMPVLAMIVLSLIVGTATHLVWDSFTHPGWLVDRVPLLDTKIGPLVLHKWLQHASSVVGLVALAIFAVRWVKRTPRSASDAVDVPSVASDRSRTILWVGVIAVFAISGALTWGVALTGGPAHYRPAPFDPTVVFLVARVSIGSALASVMLGVGVWWSVRAYRERRTATTLPSTSA